jgi:hypothetical protein
MVTLLPSPGHITNSLSPATLHDGQLLKQQIVEHDNAQIEWDIFIFIQNYRLNISLADLLRLEYHIFHEKAGPTQTAERKTSIQGEVQKARE